MASRIGGLISRAGKMLGKRDRNRDATVDDFIDACDANAFEQGAPDKTADDIYLKQIRDNRGSVRATAITDPMTSSALDYRATLAVGGDIRLKPLVMWEHLGWPSEEHERVNKEIRGFWKMFMESDNRYIDISGQHTISELAEQHARIFDAEGEAVAVIYELGENRRSPLSFAVGNLDANKIRTPRDISDQSTLDRIHDGFLKSRLGYGLGAYVHDYHSRDSRARHAGEDAYRFVPQRDPNSGRIQYIHNYVQVTSDLSRGISKLIPCLRLSHQKNQYIDASLEDAIAKAGLTFVIESSANNIQDLMGVISNKKTNHLKNYMRASNTWHEKLGIKQNNGNKIARLLHGEKLNGFSADQAGGATFEQFSETIDLIAASCHGLSLEEYRQKWDKTNFSGARSGKLYVWKMVQNLRRNAPWKFVRKVYELFLEDIILSGYLVMPNRRAGFDSWLYYMENKEAIAPIKFFGCPQDEIDRAKTAEAYIAEKELGVMTWESYCNDILGEDWDDRLDQIINEVKTTHRKLTSAGAKPSWTIDEMVTKRLFGETAAAPANAPNAEPEDEDEDEDEGDEDEDETEDKNA